MSVLKLTSQIVKTQGVTALYSGLTASLLRQLTYSTTRFGFYEVDPFLQTYLYLLILYLFIVSLHSFFLLNLHSLNLVYFHLKLKQKIRLNLTKLNFKC